MKKIFSLYFYIIPYWKNAVLSIGSNLFSSVFSVFTLATLKPFLEILLGTATQTATEPTGEFKLSISYLKDNLDYIYNTIIGTYGQSKALIIVAVTLAIFSLLRNVFAYLGLHFQAYMRAHVLRDIRNNLYQKILKLPLSYFSNERKGDIMSRMTTDVAEIEASIVSSLEMVFRDPIMILIYLGFLMSMSMQLTVFVLIMLPVSGLLIGRIGRSLRKKSFKSQSKLGSMIAIIEETLSGLRVIKAFNAEKHTNDRFQDLNKDFTNISIRINRKRALASPISEFLGTVVILIIMVYGATLILSKSIDMAPADLITFIATFYLILEPAKRLSTSYSNIMKGMASADRVDFILKAEIKIHEKENPVSKKDFESNIEYRNVGFKYDTQLPQVLFDINLKISKGKTIALVGQSGSGKSTMVDLLPRFYDITQGEILIDGVNIKDYKIKDLRNLIGIVNQEAILFNDTFYNNIVFGRENVTPADVEAAAEVAHAHEFISSTKDKYQHVIGDRGGRLSGGQRQRISIARAVLSNPPILILDEATSALDTESERLVQDALTNLMKNRTTIVIAHRLSTVIHADEICVLSEGRIVERGKHDELIQMNGYYKKLHDLQMFAN
jgi:ABC-type multidrug transport system fused ATPase/permease subunit